MKRSKGTVRHLQPHTFRLIDTVEESEKIYHELWAIDLPWNAVYQIRSIKILPDTRVEWTEKDFPTFEDALEKFNQLEKAFS
jgi:hypothetical protein